jgi:acyl transferase domain-containing protein/NADPH:quinone reductase-like Zn-dependent oxidoreductase
MIESTGFTNGSAATANDFVDAPPAATNGFTNGAGASAGADAGETELEPIAVIGMGCRLPGDVSSASDFWNLLLAGRSGQTPKVPDHRFNIDAHYHARRDRPGSLPVMGGYFINEELGPFDPAAFGVSPIEAAWMDPQQRKLLEVVYEAFESGGASLESVAGSRTGVWAASFTSDWLQMASKEPAFRHTMAATGVDPGILSDRINYVFDLRGPSLLCNTACSSSVYALHGACNALRADECDAAVVGGTNLVFTVDQQMNTAKIGVLSARSTCFTFDESADGYGRAEGVGAVYLKRLSDALRDGDPIRAVLRGSAVNHNGKASTASISYPGVQGQVYVMDEAYRRSGNLNPLDTGFIETHGTGTAVGDPIEAEAIGIALNRHRRPGVDAPLMIGAVKTNIGHGEAVSGLSALIKAVMICERGVIPPTIGIQKLTSKIKWDDWQIQVPVEPTPFPEHLPVRRVSVNTCGYGGTNAHIIVEESGPWTKGRPETYTYAGKAVEDAAGPTDRPFLLPFSAADKSSLQRAIESHAGVADKYTLHDLAFTLGTRRTRHASRAFAVASLDTLAESLAEPDAAFTWADKKQLQGAADRLGMVFTGQGAQWPRMGAALIKHSAKFRESIRAMDETLKSLPDAPAWSIEAMLLLANGEDQALVNEAEFAQPLCTAVQVALTHVLADWGVKPAVTVGHSSGEMAAAHAAGLLSMPEAIVAAYYRGQVTKDVAQGGAMMAVGLGAAEAAEHIAAVGGEGKVVVACHNSPSSSTLSGDADKLDELRARLDAEGIFARGVKTGGKAYHSHYMASVSDAYEARFRAARQSLKLDRALDASAPRDVKMVSSVTGKFLPSWAVLDETYWSANLRSPVLFQQAVKHLLASDEFADIDLLVEVGPHPAMAGPVKQIRASLGEDKANLTHLPSLTRGTDSAATLLKLAGELHARGYPLDMEAVAAAYVPDAPKGKIIVDLPSYRWNYSRTLWPESRASKEHRFATHMRHDVLGSMVIGASPSEPTWRNILRLRDLPWLRDHTLGREAVFPAAGYFAIAMEAVTQLHERANANEQGRPGPVEVESYVLRDVAIHKALVTPDNDDGIEVLTSLRHSVGRGDGWWDFAVSSIEMDNGTRKEHMAGSIKLNEASSSSSSRRAPRPSPDFFTQRATGRAWNQALKDVGFDYGTTFADMDDVRFDGRTYAASCNTTVKQVVDEALGESRYALHPACVDSALQLSIAAIYAGRTAAMPCGVVPVRVDEVTLWPPTDAQLEARDATAYAWVDQRGVRSFDNSVQLSAADGQMVLEMLHVRTTAYEAAVPQSLDGAPAPAPYGEMAWEQDVDVVAEQQQAGFSAAQLANMALFKYPGAKVLAVANDVAPAVEVLAKNPLAAYTVALTTTDEAALAAAKDAVETKFTKSTVTTIDLSADLAEQGLEAASFGVVVAPSKLLSSLKGLAKSTGFLIASDSNTIAAAETTTAAPSAGKAVLVYRKEPHAIVAQVQQALTAAGWEVSALPVASVVAEEAANLSQAILLSDLEQGPILDDMTEPEFQAIQHLTNTSSSLLWVTNGGLLEGKRPGHALASGLRRSVSSEQASLDFRTLDVDTDVVSAAQIAQSVARVATLQKAFRAGSGEEAPEREFCVAANGSTFISRLARHGALNSTFAASGEPVPTSFAPGARLVGTIQHSKVVFELLPAATAADVKQGHVEVQVECAGLTREGMLVVTGADYPTTFSHELGGVVTRVGPGAGGLSVGDRVVGFATGRFDSHAQVPANMLSKLEAGDDMPAVVSLLVAYATAGYGFDVLARLQPAETVLILNGTGATGVAAAHVVTAKKGVPYVVAATEEEATYLAKQANLPEAQILRTANGPVAEQMLALTNGHGADVVFSGGSAVDSNDAGEAWRSIARFGRFVDAGRKDVLSRGAIDATPAAQRGASYLPLDILDLLEARPEQVAGFLPLILTLFRAGLIAVPGALEAVDLSGLDAAITNWSDAFGAAKTVVEYKACELQAIPAQRQALEFQPDVTYLLVGCLGGLGRSLTSWMMESGARRFAFLSRSGADAPSAAKLVADIEAKGAIVQVLRGDATNRDDVVRAVAAVPEANPIRGVVHAAMVLRDGMFHSMAYKNWTTAVAPKVDGAANLHSVLSSTPLDFFLMTSSVSGILGTPGQANYAAANSYLDALARHRMRAGQAATACVIPMVLGVGVVAENQELEDALRRKGMYGIDEEHLLQSFEAGVVATETDHVVIGLDPALLQRAVADEAATDSFWTEDARFNHVVHSMSSSSDGGADGGAGVSVLAAIKAAATPADATTLVGLHFADKLARMLMLADDAVDPMSGSIASYGIDSMIGAELRNWIFKEYRIDIPFQQLLSPTLTINKFAGQVVATTLGA